MNYEKAYKEALEKAKEFYILCKKCEAKGTVDFLEDTFPELKESEDERIRKEIYNALRYLETELSWDALGRVDILDAYDWLEKQGEQKHVDKVEPKFKDGDWVVCEVTGSVCQIKNCIKNLSNHKYGYDLTNGGYIGSDETEHYHLWAIQDAEEGDVLEFGDHGRLVTGILSFVNKTTGKVDVSCLLEGDKFKVGVFYNLDTVKPHPVTKEKSDLLFQKIREAGYKWDDEKKELRKMEQKPKWSEEDDKRQISITEYLNELYDDNRFSLDELTDLETWLNSLKQRMEEQQ